MWSKFGFEISTYCKSFIQEHDESITVINEFEDLDEYPKNFDAIYSYHVIEHVHDVDEYLSSVKRLIKDGGIFIISTPNSASLAAKIFRRYRLLGMPHRMVFNTKPSGLVNDTIFRFLKSRNRISGPATSH